MRKLLFLIALFFTFSSFADSQDRVREMIINDESDKAIFKLGLKKASLCHDYFTTERYIFINRDRVDSQFYKDMNKKPDSNLGDITDKVIDEIYSYDGNSSEYLNDKYDECMTAIKKEYKLK